MPHVQGRTEQIYIIFSLQVENVKIARETMVFFTTTSLNRKAKYLFHFDNQIIRNRFLIETPL